MKKVFSLILALGLIASLTACGGGNASGNETGDSAPAASTAKLRFVTGGESGTYYAFGSVIAQHATNNAGINVVGLVGMLKFVLDFYIKKHKNLRSAK